MAGQETTYTRFSPAQRLEHWVMTISFTVLGITGLPQRYVPAAWADQIILWLGGIETVRIIHRLAAIVFIVVLFYHFTAVAYRIYVLRVRPTMLPAFKDVTDLLDAVRYHLGLAQQHPRFPRYNFAEKIEYWAVIWGGVLMTFTGFMLWNPIATARFLPGEFIPAAKAAHSAEALLAILAIIIWHVYWVHVRTFNRAMFSGKLTRQQMLEEHAAELERIEAGKILPPVPREVKRKRERIFLPVTMVFAVTTIFGVYLFATFEQTAITTVPPAETALAFVPATPTATSTPLPTPTATLTPTPAATSTGGQAPASSNTQALLASAPAITHELVGYEDCAACHGLETISPVPVNHVDFSLATCLICHSTQGENPPPAVIQHSLEEREDCLLCHAVDTLPESHQTAGFSSRECLLCHVSSESAIAEAGPDIAGAEPVETGSSREVGFAVDIQPLLEENCATCHGEEQQLSWLKVTDYDSLANGGVSGPAFVPGSPEASLIVEKMKSNHPGRLFGNDLQLLIGWIAAGAEDN